MTRRIIKEVWETSRNKKKARSKILMLAKNKLNSIETLISQVLIDLETSHEEFETILNEKEKYERMKKDVKMMKSSDELG